MKGCGPGCGKAARRGSGKDGMKMLRTIPATRESGFEQDLVRPPRNLPQGIGPARFFEKTGLDVLASEESSRFSAAPRGFLTARA